MKNKITVNKLIENISIMGAYILLFNLRQDKDGVFVSSSYKRRKKNPGKLKFIKEVINPTKKQIKEDCENLNKMFFKEQCGFRFKNYSDVYALFKLYIDVESIDSLIKKMTKTIDKKLFMLYGNSKKEKYYEELFFALFFINGSFDLEYKTISVDIQKYTIEYMSIFSLADIILMLFPDLDPVNLNIRWLQPQGEKRKDQLRVSVKWFMEEFGNSKSFNLFSYKKSFLKKVNKALKINNEDIGSFWYKKNKNINTIDFEGNWSGSKRITFKETKSNSRNMGIVRFIKKYQKDKCFGCFWVFEKMGLYYKTRTFKYNKNMSTRKKVDWGKSKRYYEIHHIISFANDNADKVDNLVKLCVVCHSALTKKRSNPKLTKKIIKRILNANKAHKLFAERYMKTKDEFDNVVDCVYDSLK